MKWFINYLAAILLIAFSSCSIERKATRHTETIETMDFYAGVDDLEVARKLRKSRLNVARLANIKQSQIVERYREDGTLAERVTTTAESREEEAQSEQKEEDNITISQGHEMQHARKETAKKEDSKTESKSKPPNIKIGIGTFIFGAIILSLLLRQFRIKKLFKRVTG